MENKTLGKSLQPWLWAAAGAGLLVGSRLVTRTLTRYKLRKKVVLITGGSRGLGLVLARQLAMKGARLAICARSADELVRAQQELESMNVQVLALTVDLTDRMEVKTMVHDIIAHYGQLDVVINNAGMIQIGPQEVMEVEDYEETMDINYKTALYTSLAAIPHFKAAQEGRIVNIASLAGKIAMPHLLPYSVSKYALVGLSEGMHNELKKHNILVTTVIPALIQTGSSGHIKVKGDHEAEYAWFKLSGNSPWFSQKVGQAAKKIIQGIEHNKSQVVLSPLGRLVTIFKEVAPGMMHSILATANRLLPAPVAGGEKTKNGYESESDLTRYAAPENGGHAAIEF